MNKYFLFFIFFYIPILSFSQFTIEELVSLSKKNSNDFDTYVSSKGYSIYKIDNADGIYIQKISYIKENNSGYNSYFISDNRLGVNNSLVSWQTSNISDYISIKKQLNSYGYEFVSSEIEEDTEFGNCNLLIFKKGKIEIWLYSIPREGYTNYEINVHNN